MDDPHWSSSKGIAVIISPVSNGGLNTNTPQYIFSAQWAASLGAPPLDVCSCPDYQGDGGIPANTCTNTGANVTGMPAVFETPFKTALKKFYRAVMAHLSSASYSASVAYVRAGVAVGGEAFPWCAAELESLPSVTPNTDSGLKTVWTNYANEMYTFEHSLGTSVHLMAAPDGGQNAIVTLDWADTEASYAAAQGLDIGSESLQASDIAAVSAGQACGNDWCSIFSRYQKQSPILEVQTATASDPTGQGTGSLVQLLPFALQRGANAIELYPVDLFIAFDPNYNPTNVPGYSGYGAAYRQTILTTEKGSSP